MRGFITDVDFEECDETFPGILRYYRDLDEKPTTFLELLWGFVNREEAGREAAAAPCQAGLSSHR